MWIQLGVDRLKTAGFTDEEVRKWEKGIEKNEEDVRWSKEGESREWDKGKILDGGRSLPQTYDPLPNDRSRISESNKSPASLSRDKTSSSQRSNTIPTMTISEARGTMQRRRINLEAWEADKITSTYINDRNLVSLHHSTALLIMELFLC
jgi:hypothetical protein